MKTTWISTTWRCYKILQIRLVVVEYKYDRTALRSNPGMRIFIVSRLLLAPVLIACQPIYRERNNPRPVLDHSQQPQATVWGNSMLTARAELPSCSPQTLSTHFRYQAVLSLQLCYDITPVTLRILEYSKTKYDGAVI